MSAKKTICAKIPVDLALLVTNTLRSNILRRVNKGSDHFVCFIRWHLMHHTVVDDDDTSRLEWDRFISLHVITNASDWIIYAIHWQYNLEDRKGARDIGKTWLASEERHLIISLISNVVSGHQSCGSHLSTLEVIKQHHWLIKMCPTVHQGYTDINKKQLFISS